ncbi:differentially expressed in FDCP 8 [Biomphalaria pfeifferi]|uniref:Differentially expressed in FDCP 8 n=1 Tax=Biomphalaria pfeifferi TaxID=112525 RepID=A0AAD8B0P7_BIOPF|nr:differentially expressed in FDCP 8 [Biomphalaria pfeifferi]
MEREGAIKFVETSTATVKMSGGIPFVGTTSLHTDSEDSEPEYEQQDIHSETLSRPRSTRFRSISNVTSVSTSAHIENNNILGIKNTNINTFNHRDSGNNGFVNKNKLLNLDLDSSHSNRSRSSTDDDDLNTEAESRSTSRTPIDSNNLQVKGNTLARTRSNRHEAYVMNVPNAGITLNTSENEHLNTHHHKHVYIPKGYYCSQPNNSSNFQPDSSSSKDGKYDSINSGFSNISIQANKFTPRQNLHHNHHSITSKLNRASYSSSPDGDNSSGTDKGNNSPSTDKGAISPSTDKRGTNRINPFNKYSDLNVDEDYFSDSQENFFKTDHHSNSSVQSSGKGYTQEANVSYAELGLSEDHFSHPQGLFGLSCSEELELAIDNCKEMIRDATPGSDKQKNLIMKLVQLRIKLHEVKEGPEPVPENVKVILSHKMMMKKGRSSKYYCEKCNGVIWGMIQVWYRCTQCGYRCHEKCLQQILRTCAYAKVLDDPTLIMDIAPKDPHGLMAQNFRCWECRSPISFKTGSTEPRLCDYNGRYYCELCHWNDTFIIPARVLHNWDFTPQKVCRASKQFLKLMQKKAVIRILDVNPMLFVYIDQLNEIKKLREEMMVMKKYILSCASAMSAKLLLLLESRQHFVESSDRYSMQDLLDSEEILLPELVRIHSTWAQHIKVDCQLCQGHGFCCELCNSPEILFPFDNIAVVCPNCSCVTHRHCAAKKLACLRCERRDKRHAEIL